MGLPGCARAHWCCTAASVPVAGGRAHAGGQLREGGAPPPLETQGRAAPVHAHRAACVWCPYAHRASTLVCVRRVRVCARSAVYACVLRAAPMRPRARVCQTASAGVAVVPLVSQPRSAKARAVERLLGTTATLGARRRSTYRPLQHSRAKSTRNSAI